MKAKQSAELTAFYQAYVDWLNKGAPEKNQFEFLRGTGLCANLRFFCFSYGCWGGSVKFIEEMEAQFKTAGLDKGFPFDSGPYTFNADTEKDICHLNPKRIKWARDHS